MTNISFVLSTVTMSLSAYLAYSYYKSDVKPADEMTWILKVFWIMSTTSPTIAVAVSLNYWIFVYTPEHFQIDFNNVMSHIMNAVIPLIDVWIIKQPGKFQMCIFPTLFGAIYLLFTWLYPALGGMNRKGENFICPFLDWIDNPKLAFISGTVFLVQIVIIHAVITLIVNFRIHLHQRKIKYSNELQF